MDKNKSTVLQKCYCTKLDTIEYYTCDDLQRIIIYDYIEISEPNKHEYITLSVSCIYAVNKYADGRYTPMVYCKGCI